MDIVLGVSLTPETVRIVLVEGVQADGAIVDHDTFDVSPSDDIATSNAAEQVVAAVLGTQESAREGGHELKAVGVTWSDHAEAAQLREALKAHNIDDAVLVSELHAAGALAQTAGRAMGYESTALLFLDRDVATLSVVQTDGGSIVKVLSRSLHSTDAMAVLADMASAVAAQDIAPQGMFVVGSGVDVASVKSHLQDLVSIPVNAPEESGLALARGAALAAANAPVFDASTVGLAYSQDPDGATAGNDYPDLAGAVTQMRLVGAAIPPADVADFAGDGYADDAFAVDAPLDEGRKPFLLVGSALTSVFIIGVVALVISLAVSIRPTADQRPDPGQSAIIPSAAAPAPPLPEVAVPAPAPAPAPPPETIRAPMPVVQEQQAPPRQVYVAPAPAPQAPAPIVEPPPAAPPPPPPPAFTPPVILPPIVPIYTPPVYNPPVYDYSRPRSPWNPWPQKPPRESNWPQWPPRDSHDESPQSPQYPQAPATPPVTQVPQRPQSPWPQSGSGSSGSDGSGSYGPGRSGGSGGSGGGGSCFLIFCSSGGGGGGYGGH